MPSELEQRRYTSKKDRLTAEHVDTPYIYKDLKWVSDQFCVKCTGIK